jgi:hypothetical protein
MSKTTKKQGKSFGPLSQVVAQTEGLHANTKMDVQKAKIQLEKVKELEAEKLSKGFIWVTKEKISKLVHPDKAKQLTKDGWTINKSIKQKQQMK